MILFIVIPADKQLNPAQEAGFNWSVAITSAI